jgi:hypothetical protein
MRLRFTVLACAISALAFTAIPSIASAAPHHNRGLTIHALPRQIIAGEAVLIYGQLKGPDHADQMITLYHRVNPAPTFSVIGTTQTNALGQYEFTRADGIVLSNRSWYVRGPLLTHSRTVHERVAALVSLAANPTSGLTRHPIVFTGHVTPDHTGSVVVLQAQNGSSDNWTTLKRAVVGAGSNYQISQAWRTPGERDVRVLFRGDGRNTPAPSDPVSVTIQQTQIPDFTINTTDPIVDNDSPATISGVLDQPGTTTPEPTTSVSLFAREPDGGPFKLVSTQMTGTDGSYGFTEQTTTNELYEARTTFAPPRHSAVLFQGVQDVVTMTGPMTSTVNGNVAFTGDVSPGKAGHVIYLQKFGADNNWHTVEVGLVHADSTFQFGWTFGTAGTKEFRARITGGPANVGGASAPVTVDVTQPALTLLPTG